MNDCNRKSKKQSRRGVTLVLAAMFSVVMLGLIACAVDLGHVVLVRTQLQVAADSSAMAAAASMRLTRKDMLAVARQFAGYHTAQGRSVELLDEEVEYGTWDAKMRRFAPSATPGNAVRVTARADESTTGDSRLFFGRIFGRASFAQRASAVAMANPRDIAFVVDLSGSMNDDTEPCWATGAINDTFAADGYPTVGSELMQQVFSDFGFGSYPGVLQYLGAPYGVPQNKYAYAELTKDGGPLTKKSVPKKYRIQSKHDEKKRKEKAYSAIIDNQLADLMPNAEPTPGSGGNYAYWEKYLDYVIYRAWDSSRGWLPPSQDSDRITGFNNPNRTSFPQASSSVPRGFRNKIGYRTYVQFMMDHGRDLKPVGNNYVPLSRHSADCSWHDEATAGGTFSFPPREQPTHAVRRALIAAIQVVKERNSSISDSQQCDWVSIVTFDRVTGGGPIVKQSLTADYDAAMLACTDMQAVGDKGASTATEAGMITAREHIKPQGQGGAGRYSTNKIVVLLTDGMPNIYVTNRSDINQYVDNNPSNDFYDNGKYAYDAALMQAAQMQADRWYTYPVGVGLGTDYDFMDRIARMGETANDGGRSARGSGNPAEYEQRLTEIFEEIITNPKVRIVQ